MIITVVVFVFVLMFILGLVIAAPSLPKGGSIFKRKSCSCDETFDMSNFKVLPASEPEVEYNLNPNYRFTGVSKTKIEDIFE